jgi:hypothetical protein
VRSILAAISDVGFSGDSCRSPGHEKVTGFDPKRSSKHADKLAASSSPEASRGRLQFNRLVGPRMAIIELDITSWKSKKFGKIAAPQFTVVGWVGVPKKQKF